MLLGNSTSKKFTLHVLDNVPISEPKEPEIYYFDDIIDNYKKDNTKVGIDVSKWQGEIDWQKVKEAGVEFAIIRMGYQTDYDGENVIDPYFIKNIECAKEAGIPVRSLFLFLC